MSLNLSNEQQLWIMEKVKTMQFSLDDAEQAASIMSGKPEVMAAKPPPIKIAEQVDCMDSSRSITFSVVRFPDGFKGGRWIKNSMQFDFRKENIYFMDKITIHLIVFFSDIIDCSSKENDFGIKLVTMRNKIKFSANIDEKTEIERLISMIIQRNEFKNVPPTPTSIPPEINRQVSQEDVTDFHNKRTILKEGIVEKKGNAAIVRWSKRYLRLKEKEFSYYELSPKEDPLGVVQINASTGIAASKSEKDTFIVTVGKRSYYFRVKNYETPEKTESERNSWIQAFKSACSKKTILKHWARNRNSFFPQDQTYPVRSASPPVDYDKVDGAGHSQPKEFEMKELVSSTSRKVRFCDSGEPKFEAPPDKFTIPPMVNSETSPSRSGPKGSLFGPSPSSPRIESTPSGPPPPTGAPPPPRPPPPPGPPPPPIPGTQQKQTIALKAHSDIKLKHFFVPKVSLKEKKKTIWADLNDITQRLDRKLLEEYFTETRNTAASMPKETKKSSYMDEKKTQNILILMKSDLFIETVKQLRGLLNSIQPPEDTKIDIIRTLQKYQPTEDEIELYQKLAAEKKPLSKADEMMFALCSIPCLRKRLELILNLWTFEGQYKEFKQFLKLLTTACKEILNSQKFPKVLEYILAISNLMNTSGSSKSGSALEAFHLKFISQLKNIQSAQGSNLLKMLVSQIKKTSPELLDFHKELSTVKTCGNISVKAVHAMIEVLKMDFKSIAKNSKAIQSMIKNPTPKEKEFFMSIKELSKTLQQKLDSTVKESDEIQKNYSQILILFGLPSDTSSEDIFEYFVSFMQDFIKIQSEN